MRSGRADHLAFRARYQIETCWDYAYVEISTNGGATFSSIPTSASTNDNENGQNFGNGITGTSGSPKVCVSSAPRSGFRSPPTCAYAGQTIRLRFRYWTEGGRGRRPFGGRNRDHGGGRRGGDRPGLGVRRLPDDWDDHRVVFQRLLRRIPNYRGYDDGLRTGPYNFGFLNNAALQKWVEHFPYQDGLLVWYYDTSFPDNNVGDACLSGRCGGLDLPVDAHPDLLIRPDNGKVWRPRIQSYDSTFGLELTDRICLHANSVVQCYGSLPANPLFDDTRNYWVPPNASIDNFGWSGVQVPRRGRRSV